jgi:hypothetical protein
MKGQPQQEASSGFVTFAVLFFPARRSKVMSSQLRRYQRCCCGGMAEVTGIGIPSKNRKDSWLTPDDLDRFAVPVRGVPAGIGFQVLRYSS